MPFSPDEVTSETAQHNGGCREVGSGSRTRLMRSCCGLSKNSSGAFCSTIWPWSIKITRFATFMGKAHFMRYANHGHNFPARPTIVSSTSLIISGSSADVGSSNSIMRGFIHSERAIATRVVVDHPKADLDISMPAQEFSRAPENALQSLRLPF